MVFVFFATLLLLRHIGRELRRAQATNEALFRLSRLHAAAGSSQSVAARTHALQAYNCSSIIADMKIRSARRVVDNKPGRQEILATLLVH